MNGLVTWAIQTVIMLGIGVIGYLIKQNEKKTDERITQNERKIDLMNEKFDSEVEALKDKINNLKEELPQKYVIRDDFIRAMSNVDTKLDKIYDIITIKKGGE